MTITKKQPKIVEFDSILAQQNYSYDSKVSNKVCGACFDFIQLTADVIDGFGEKKKPKPKSVHSSRENFSVSRRRRRRQCDTGHLH